MTDPETPAEHLDTESQEERGEPGSRDGGHAPGEGPSDRPVGTTEDETSVDSQGTEDPDMPHMPAGG